MPGSLFIATSIVTVMLVLWSIDSLPISTRGRELVTDGAFRYFRHPLYAAFLSCFNFGFAALLNNWIYVIGATILHGAWHLNIMPEEKFMKRRFPKAYDDYCKNTGRFLPRLWKPHRERRRGISIGVGLEFGVVPDAVEGNGNC